MEWAARKKKAVQACPQCYRLIEKGGGCKCVTVTSSMYFGCLAVDRQFVGQPVIIQHRCTCQTCTTSCTYSFIFAAIVDSD